MMCRPLNPAVDPYARSQTAYSPTLFRCLFQLRGDGVAVGLQPNEPTLHQPT